MTNSKKASYFFLILPFLDVITSLITRNSNITFTPGIIIKGIFLLFLVIFILLTKSKYKKISIISLIFIFLYIIMYLITKNGLIKEGFLFNELHHLFKLIYFPITFLGLLCFYDGINFDKKNINKTLLITSIIYFFLLTIPLITKTAYHTYPISWQGFVGWFYAGNEIGNIMILLLPASYFLVKKNKYSFLSLLPIYYITIQIGTKVATFGVLLVSLITLFYYIIKKDFKKSIISLFILIFVSLLIPNSYAIKNYQNAYSQNEKVISSYEPINIEKNHIEEVNTIINNINNFYNRNRFNKLFKNLLNGRDILLANTLSIYNDNKSTNTILFGIGFSNIKSINNGNIGRLIEIDVLDGNFHYGLIGLIIMVSPFIICGYLIIKNKTKITKESIYYILIILLILGISTFSGHVLTAPAVSIYLVLYLLLLLNEFKIFQRKEKNLNEISILALHLNYGGIERSIVNQANMLSKDYEVKIVSLYNFGIIPYELNNNVKVIYLTNFIPNRDDFKKAVNNKNIFKIIKEGIKGIYILYLKKVLLINYIYECNSKIIISSRIDFTKLLNNYADYNTIKIAEEHVYHHNDKKYLKKVLNSLTNIDYLIPSSKYLTKDYQELCKNLNVKVNYIPQIIDNYPTKANNCDNFNIISVGRFSKEKGFDDLIKIMKIINENNKHIKLTLVGDGDEYYNLNKQIKKYNLKNIKLTGFLNSKELKKEYQKATLFVMTSHEESFGLVLIEAMSYGIPCFAFDSALGAKEIINSKNGLLIPNRDINLMADEIIKYFEKTTHDDLIKEARKTALEYDFTIVQKQYLKFIKKILEEK